jgi:hypothetical protein
MQKIKTIMCSVKSSKYLAHTLTFLWLKHMIALGNSSLAREGIPNPNSNLLKDMLAHPWKGVFSVTRKWRRFQWCYKVVSPSTESSSALSLVILKMIINQNTLHSSQLATCGLFTNITSYIDKMQLLWSEMRLFIMIRVAGRQRWIPYKVENTGSLFSS